MGYHVPLVEVAEWLVAQRIPERAATQSAYVTRTAAAPFGLSRFLGDLRINRQEVTRDIPVLPMAPRSGGGRASLPFPSLLRNASPTRMS